ncbi:MAG: hypothetical protein HQK53_15855 [Oligoflexia bacterium]|nr:hypothetical protein [Oligoflexia bacterium]
MRAFLLQFLCATLLVLQISARASSCSSVEVNFRKPQLQGWTQQYRPPQLGLELSAAPETPVVTALTPIEVTPKSMLSSSAYVLASATPKNPGTSPSTPLRAQSRQELFDENIQKIMSEIEFFSKYLEEYLYQNPGQLFIHCYSNEIASFFNQDLPLSSSLPENPIDNFQEIVMGLSNPRTPGKRKMTFNCLQKISLITANPTLLFTLLKKMADPTINNFLRSSLFSEDAILVQLITNKIIKKFLDELVFKYYFSELLPNYLRNAISVIGFNREGAPNRRLMSSASDKDFKVVIDPKLLSFAAEESCGVFFSCYSSKVTNNNTIETAKKDVLQALEKLKKIYEEYLDLYLEINQYTIQTVDEIADIASAFRNPQKHKEQYFYSTIIADEDHKYFYDNPAVNDQIEGIFYKMRNILKRASPLESKKYQQYLGKKTTKKSLNTFHVHSSSPGLLPSTNALSGEPTRVIVNGIESTEETFTLLNINEWKFNTKYYLVRLNDLYPLNRKAFLFAMVGMEIQQLICNLIYDNPLIINREEYRQQAFAERNLHYEEIDHRLFLAIFKKYPNEIKRIMDIVKPLFSEILVAKWVNIDVIIDSFQRNHQLTDDEERELITIGYHFFHGLYMKAIRIDRHFEGLSSSRDLSESNFLRE